MSKRRWLPQLVLQIDALLQDRLAAGEQPSHVMALHALDVRPAVPKLPKELL
ncbi:hypothetical protein WKW77_33885 [Variovorax ureilyticus]|uniref:Uncharacterized protein n=1 Tax=Variovorax ureilyticus TaxID=1836198 RepID=A0ABU8VR54_9BURK